MLLNPDVCHISDQPWVFQLKGSYHGPFVSAYLSISVISVCARVCVFGLLIDHRSDSCNWSGIALFPRTRGCHGRDATVRRWQWEQTRGETLDLWWSYIFYLFSFWLNYLGLSVSEDAMGGEVSKNRKVSQYDEAQIGVVYLLTRCRYGVVTCSDP